MTGNCQLKRRRVGSRCEKGFYFLFQVDGSGGRTEIGHQCPSLRSQQREQTSCSECHRRPTALRHVNLSERQMDRGRHCLLRGVQGVMASSGRWQTACVWVCDGEIRPLRSLGDVHCDLSFCLGLSLSVHLTTTLKGPGLPETLTGVYVCTWVRICG